MGHSICQAAVVSKMLVAADLLWIGVWMCVAEALKQEMLGHQGN